MANKKTKLDQEEVLWDLTKPSERLDRYKALLKRYRGCQDEVRQMKKQSTRMEIVLRRVEGHVSAGQTDEALEEIHKLWKG